MCHKWHVIFVAMRRVKAEKCPRHFSVSMKNKIRSVFRADFYIYVPLAAHITCAKRKYHSPHSDEYHCGFAAISLHRRCAYAQLMVVGFSS